MGPLSKLGSFQEQMSANTKRQMRTRRCLFIYLSTMYFLQLHQSIMSVILALFDILIPNDILQILHCHRLTLPPIEDNIISWKVLPAWLYFSFLLLLCATSLSIFFPS